MKTIQDSIQKFISDNNIDKELYIRYQEYKKDPLINSIIKRLDLSDDILIKNASKLVLEKNEYLNCSSCQGLFECKNVAVGYRSQCYNFNNTFQVEYVACPYQQKIDNKKRLQNNIYTDNIPQEILGARVKDLYKDDENRVNAIKAGLKFLKEYKKDPTTKGLYLHGSFGSGKTYLLAAIANELAKDNVRTAILYWPEFLRSLKGAFKDDFNDRFNYIKKIKVLMIDDIGAENMTPWSRDEILGPILQYRMQEKLPTFFSSNFSINELEKHFASSGNGSTLQVKARRIIERIDYLTSEVKMSGKNRRK